MILVHVEVEKNIKSAVCELVLYFGRQGHIAYQCKLYLPDLLLPLVKIA